MISGMNLLTIQATIMPVPWLHVLPLTAASTVYLLKRETENFTARFEAYRPS